MLTANLFTLFLSSAILLAEEGKEIGRGEGGGRKGVELLLFIMGCNIRARC